ncbi:MAG TPA: PAS domain S-box protein [Nostocaceae cyanobacterium]|nr:PAS domain S-box protein [Nostocaceae cyanobacterium]
MERSLTVLIIDDSPEDRQVYRRYLQQDQEHTYTILEAELGDEALELCEQYRPDGILLDFLLPDLDGLEFLAELKQQNKSYLPAVIMLTGYGNEAVAVQAMKSGIQDYLVKGQITAEHLSATVNSAIKNAQLRQELQKSEERFRTSVENMLDCFGIYSAIRNEQNEITDFRIDYVNAAACECHQLTKEEQLGQKLCEILPVYRESGLFTEYCQVVETGEPLVKEAQEYIYSNGYQELIRAFDIRIRKMEDGFVASWRDVTEKKQAEEKLRLSNERFQLAAAAVNCLIYDWDFEKDRIIRTEGLTRVLGYSLQEAQPTLTWWKNLIHPEDRYCLQQLSQAGFAEQNSYSIEYRMLHKDQKYRYVLDQGLIVRDADNRVVRAVGSVTDITEQKLALSDRLRVEAALRQSEGKFRRLFESNVIGIYFGDFSGKIFEANDAFLQMFGYARAELEAGIMRWDMMTPPEYYSLDQQKVQELRTGSICIPFEKEYFHKDGTRIPILLGIARMEESEQEGYSVCIIINLTKRKQAEDALRQSEELYRYLSNSIPQIVWIDNSQGECEYVNRRWEEYTGKNFKQALGSGWTDIINPDDLLSVLEGWKSSINQGIPYEFELRYRRFDGEYRWHLVRGLPIWNEQGNIIKWFGTATDIDDRKQFETERNQLLELEKAAREEAERANQIKDEFVAMVSHDLRSPLNAILGWAKLLQTRPVDTDTLNRALATIERNAQAQAKLLEDLLNISRILRGKFQLELEEVNLVSIVSAAIETAYPTAEAKGINLESIIDQSIPPITGDVHRLLQVLGNLLSNAVKFTPSGGKVEVSLSKLNDQQVKFAQITVSDTGIGIQPQFLPYVFERYQQGDRAHRQHGLGLGLAIARHIVELHHGTIDAASPGPGLGSTFTVKLPLNSNI